MYELEGMLFFSHVALDQPTEPSAHEFTPYMRAAAVTSTASGVDAC